MRQNQKGFGIVEISVVLILICILAGVFFYFFKDRTRESIKYEGKSFSFDLGVPAKVISKSPDGKTIEYYEATPSGSTKTLTATVYKPQATNDDLRDTCKYEKLEVTILSKIHTLCDQKHKLYIANFDSGGIWYQVTVFPGDSSSELEQADVVRLVESLKTK